MSTINELVKSTVRSMSDSNDSKISVAANEILNEVRTTVVNETIVKDLGVGIQNLVTKGELANKADKADLELKADIAVVNEKANKADLEDKANKTDLFKNGVFNTGWTADDGSTHNFIAEANDFGGIFGFNSPKNIKSFVGLNKSNDLTNIDAQLYAVDNTRRVGTRININTDGAYYLANTTNLGTPAGREIAVKDDIPDTSNFITADRLDEKADKSAVDTLSTEIENKADKSAIPDMSNYVTIAALDNKADRNNTYTKDEVVALLGAKANLEDVYRKVDTYSAEKIQELLDLEANKDTVYTINQVDNKLAEKADKSDLDSKADKSSLFNNQGVFSTGWIADDGSWHRIETEANDFGGIFAFNAPRHIKSFIGLNKSETDDDIDGQIYAVNPTTKIGMRLNLSSHGAFYSNGTDNVGMPAENELAVKGDIPNISNLATQEEVASLEARVNNDLAGKANKSDIPDLSGYALDADVRTKADNAEFLEFKANVASALTNKVEQSNIDDLSIQINNKLSLKANTSDLVGLATEAYVEEHAYDDTPIYEELNKKVNSTQVWNAKGDYFETTYNYPSGSYAKIWNENDGGGSLVYDRKSNVKSYVGTNLEENTSDQVNAINVQVYSINPDTKNGVRINVNPNKAYYLVGASKINVDSREIAVKGDIPDTSEFITRAEAQQMVDNAIINLLEQIQAEFNVNGGD